MSDLDLFRKLTTLHLTQEEKRFMQQNVLLHARERGILSPLTSLFVFSRSFVSVTAMALLLLVGTTVVHGAERSIPGDALYAMKRGVNERVLGALAQSDEAKARLETKFVDRRLEEIQKIIVQEDTQDIADSASIGEVEQELSISPETLAIVVTLTEEVKEHAKKAEVHIEKVSDEGGADDALVLASELESAIDVHTSTIATLTEDGGEDTTLVAIAEAVQQLVDSSSSVGVLGDTIAVAIVSDTSMVDREKAEAQLAEAEKLLALYVDTHPVIIPEIVSESDVLVLPENETPLKEAVLSTESELFGTSVTTALFVEEVSELTSDASARDVETVPEEIVVIDEVAVVEDIPTTTVYVLPTLEEVQTQITACKVFIDTGDYANAYIACTDALQNISTLTQVYEKNIVSDVVVQEDVSSSVVDEQVVVEDTGRENGQEKIKEKIELSQKESLDSSMLTSKVLDAFDQAR